MLIARQRQEHTAATAAEEQKAKNGPILVQPCGVPWFFE
jgi:hypothetical protein